MTAPDPKPPRVSDEEVERLIARLHAYAPEEGEAWTVASLLAERRALTAERDKWREDREDWRVSAASAWRQLIEAEAQVAALTATIEAQARVIGETRRRALQEALASVGHATDLAEAADRIKGRIAALRTSAPEELNHG